MRAIGRLQVMRGSGNTHERCVSWRQEAHDMKTTRSILCRMALPVLFLSGAAVAHAEVTDCTAITAIPTTISAPGVYCLTSNLVLSSTGVAIHIYGPKDVVLDLNGHS